MNEENVVFPGQVEAMIAALKNVGQGSLAEQLAQDLSEAVKAMTSQALWYSTCFYSSHYGEMD